MLNSVEYSADDIDLAITLNKALDIVHFRSDLAAAFIEGGQQTCALVSNLPSKFVVLDLTQSVWLEVFAVLNARAEALVIWHRLHPTSVNVSKDL